MIIYQNDPSKIKYFRMYGCYYFSILELLRREFYIPLDMGYAERQYLMLQNNQIADLRYDCLVESPQAVIDSIVGGGKMEFLGKFTQINAPKGEDIRLIEYWQGEKTTQTHFTLPDYDPWRGGSPWRKNLIGYRVYRRI